MDGLKLMAEYGGTVLWHLGGDHVGPVDPDSLEIGRQLKKDIAKWAATYDATFCEQNPSESGFTSPDAKSAFEAEGRRIWRELQRELGSKYKVAYFSELDQCVIE